MLPTLSTQIEAKAKLPRLQGDGDPDCPKCRGCGTVRKVYTAEELRALPPWEIPSMTFVSCPCTAKRRARAAIERVWSRILTVPTVAESPFAGQATRSLRVTAKADTMAAHLGRLLKGEPSLVYSMRVVTDAQLLAAEYSYRKDQRREQHQIPTEDGQQVEEAQTALEAADLYSPPGLLVLLIGQLVKPKKEIEALADVVLTACRSRANQGKHTWIVDHPRYLLDDASHPAHSDMLIEEIEAWQRIALEAPEARVRRSAAQPVPKRAQEPSIPDSVLRDLEARGVDLTPNPERPDGGLGRCLACGAEDCQYYRGSANGATLAHCAAKDCPSQGKYLPLAAVDKLAKRAKPAAKALTARDAEDAAACGPQVEAASRWLREQLADGPRPLALVEANAPDAGISERTLYRARTAIGAVASGPAGARMLSLPQAASSCFPPAASTALASPIRAISEDEIEAAINGV